MVDGKTRQRMNIGAENQQAEKEKTGIRKIEGLFAVVEGKARRADEHRRRKPAGGERKTESRKPKGCLPLSRERRDGRMDTGAENQQAEKEKRNQGNRRAVCRCRGKGATADEHRRRKTVSGERKDGIRKTEGLFAVVEGKARRADGHRRKDVIEDGEEKQICVGQ